MINSFDEQYSAVLHKIINFGYAEKNERTGEDCKSLPGITMQFDLEKQFPILNLRNINPMVFIAEQIWYLSGQKNISQLQKYTRIWDEFTNEKNELPTSYGYRWRKHFGRDQILDLIHLLKNDKTSRHGVVSWWDPGKDGLNGEPQKNIPCPFTFTVNIIGGRCHLHLVIRSNDMILGNPHDVSGFAILSHFIAQCLKVKPGLLTVSISNAHIYKKHINIAYDLLSSKSYNLFGFKFITPDMALERALVFDETLIRECFKQFSDYEKNTTKFGKISIVL